VYLDVGFYDPTSFCNEVQAKVSAYVLANYPDMVPFPNTLILGAFAASTNHITFQFILNAQVPAIVPPQVRFYFIETCNFITRGRAFAHFAAFPDFGLLGVPPPDVVTSYESGSAAMHYTRFVTVHSDAINQFSYAETRTSDPLQGGKMIAVIGVASDIINATNFTGAFLGGDVVQAPWLSVLNPMKQFQKFLDFYFRDEFGTDLGEAFPPYHQLGVCLWLEVTF
jgi:hypothetical protein